MGNMDDGQTVNCSFFGNIGQDGWKDLLVIVGLESIQNHHS